MSIFISPAQFGVPDGAEYGYTHFSPVGAPATYAPNAVFGAKLDENEWKTQKSPDEIRKKIGELNVALDAVKSQPKNQKQSQTKAEIEANIALLTQILRTIPPSADTSSPAAPAAPAAQAGQTAQGKSSTRAAGVIEQSCNVSEYQTKLGNDKKEIDALKALASEQASNATQIQSKVKLLKTELADAQAALKTAQAEIASKGGDHAASQTALAEAQKRVSTCAANISKIDESVNHIGDGLQQLRGAIQTLADNQRETLKELEIVGAAKK